MPSGGSTASSFADAGLAWTIGRRMVLDAAAGAGWRDGYPDGVATSGATILLGAGS